MIRKIGNADLEIIYNLGSLYDKNFKNKYIIENYINNNIYIMNCYKDENHIKGFVIAYKLFETVEILLIYVDEKFRKLGIASKLMKSVEDSNADNLLLEVSVNNNPAIQLYKKLGYDIISTRKEYYNGVDAYVMKKVLK